MEKKKKRKKKDNVINKQKKFLHNFRYLCKFGGVEKINTHSVPQKV